MLPLWLLKRVSMTGGVRLPKPPGSPVEVAGLCPVCSKAVLRSKILGIENLQGTWISGSFYHWACRQDYVPIGPSTGWEHYRRSVERNYSTGERKVPAGNLGNEEYRYWIGCNCSPGNSSWAMCRCCRTCTYGRAERVKHFADPKFTLMGDNCSVRIVNAFKQLENHTHCVICKKLKVGKGRWGAPICDQVDCEIKWKFGQEHWLPIAQIFHLQKKKSVFFEKQEFDKEYAKIKAQGYTPCTIVGKDGKDMAMGWCNMCNMFTNEPNHEVQHALGLQTGGKWPN